MVEQIDQKAAIELINDQQRLIAELNEKLMFCSQAAEARMIARMREPDAKMVEVTNKAFAKMFWGRDWWDTMPPSYKDEIAKGTTAALSAAADAMEVGDEG